MDPLTAEPDGASQPVEAPETAHRLLSRIRRRNRREAASACALAVASSGFALVLQDPALRSAAALFALSSAVIATVLIGSWPRPSSGDQPVSAELARQARVLELAPFSYVAPLFLASSALALALDAGIRHRQAPSRTTTGVLLTLAAVHFLVLWTNVRAARDLRRAARASAC